MSKAFPRNIGFCIGRRTATLSGTEDSSRMHLGSTFDMTKYQELEQESLRRHCPGLQKNTTRTDESEGGNISTFGFFKRLAKKTKSAILRLIQRKRTTTDYIPFAEFEAMSSADVVQGQELEKADASKKNEESAASSSSEQASGQEQRSSLDNRSGGVTRVDNGNENECLSESEQLENEESNAQAMGEQIVAKAVVSTEDQRSESIKSAEELMAERIQRQRNSSRIQAGRMARQRRVLALLESCEVGNTTGSATPNTGVSATRKQSLNKLNNVNHSKVESSCGNDSTCKKEKQVRLVGGPALVVPPQADVDETDRGTESPKSIVRTKHTIGRGSADETTLVNQEILVEAVKTSKPKRMERILSLHKLSMEELR